MYGCETGGNYEVHIGTEPVASTIAHITICLCGQLLLGHFIRGTETGAPSSPRTDTFYVVRQTSKRAKRIMGAKLSFGFTKDSLSRRACQGYRSPRRGAARL